MKIALLTTDNREHFRDFGNPRPYFGTAPEALLQGFAALPDIEVHVVACLQKPAASPSMIAPNIFYHGLHVAKIGWLRTGYQGCIRATRRKLGEINPDIVHGQGTERDCALSAVFSGRPNVVTIHGNMRLIAQVNRPALFTYGWFAARLEAWTLPRTDGVVCITHYTQAAVADLARRTWVVPNAVDAKFFDVKPSPAPETVILVVGQVCLRKNQNALIRALDPLARQHRFKVVFLGGVAKGDPYGEEFRALLATRPWCEHGGFASREKLRERLGTTALLALPSLEDNCPMVVLEAMAASVPVAAANVGGVPDLIAPGKTGVLFDPLSESSMRQAVEELLRDPARRGRFAADGRADAVRRFHPEVIARRHLEIYREVLSTRS